MRRSEVVKLHHSTVDIDQEELQQLKKKSQSTPLSKLCCVCTNEYIKAYNWSIFTCEHNEICLNCLNAYVDHSLQQKNLPKCVVSKCPGQLKIDDLDSLHILTIKILNRLRQCLKSQVLKNNKKCTMPDCYGFINNGTCELCLTNFCENCYEKEHRGQCKIQSIDLGENIKQCPECGQGIEHDGGCLHMVCIHCKYAFCFKCQQIWSSRHHVTCGTGDSSIIDWILNFFTGSN